MARWARFAADDGAGFGQVESESIRVFEGDLFNRPRPTGATRRLADVRLAMPVQPSKVIAVWNNYRALLDKMSLRVPAEPLYFPR